VTEQLVFNVGIVLIFVGIIVSFIAVILMTFAGKKRKGKFRGGGAVIIGPFPIIFGTDKESVKALLLLSIILVVVLLIVMTFFRYVMR